LRGRRQRPAFCVDAESWTYRRFTHGHGAAVYLAGKGVALTERPDLETRQPAGERR
jgi:hypothetical protein